MMKRKTAVASVALTAALVLAACGAPEEEDPLAPLTNGNEVSNTDTGGLKVDGKEIIIDEDEILSPEEIEELDKNRPLSDEEQEARKKQESRSEEVPTGNDANVNDRNLGMSFEPHHFGFNPSDIEVPESIEEAYPDDDTDRIVSDALEALEWADMNFTSKMKQDRSPYLIDSLVGYMAGYLSDEAEQEFRDSLEGTTDVQNAWTLMPFYMRTISTSEESYLVAEDGMWDSAIGRVKVLDDLNDPSGQPLGGAIVELTRTVYVPLEDNNTEMLAVNYGLHMLMTPTVEQGEQKWEIGTWRYNLSSAELVERIPTL